MNRTTTNYVLLITTHLRRFQLKVSTRSSHYPLILLGAFWSSSKALTLKRKRPLHYRETLFIVIHYEMFNNSYRLALIRPQVTASLPSGSTSETSTSISLWMSFWDNASAVDSEFINDTVST